MKAAALTASRTVGMIDLPDAEPGAGEVKLRVAYCGICGSDMHEYESAKPLRTIGLMQPVMGHEFSGRIVAVGAGVTEFAVGQTVTGNPGGGCGACYYCSAGREQLCREGPAAIGYTRAGAYAEYVTLPLRSVVPLPSDASLEHAALTEPFAVARHALIEGGYSPAGLLVVAGAGPIGLLTVIAAREIGGQRIVVSEPLQGRRDAARRCGASHVVEPAQLLAVVHSLSEGLGAAVCVDASGLPAGIADCQNAAMRGGHIVLAGVGEQPYSLDILRAIINEHRFIGVLGYTRAEFADAARLIVSRAVDVSPVISGVVPLETTPDAFARLSAGRDGLCKLLVSPRCLTRRSHLATGRSRITIWALARTCARAATELVERSESGQPETRTPRSQAILAHIIDTDPGGCWAADVNGLLVGYAQGFVRGDIWFLAQLFVQPELHALAIGRELLRRSYDYGREGGARVFSVISSTSPVAQSLYMRHDMFAIGIGYHVSGRVDALRTLPEPSANKKRIVDCAGWHDRIAELDRFAFGAELREDHAYYLTYAWTNDPGISFGLTRDGDLVGYGYADPSGFSGPLAAYEPDD